MTGPIPDLDLDLDAPEPQNATGGPSGAGLLTAVGLVGAGLGALAGALLTSPEPDQAPPLATLGVRDLHLETSGPPAEGTTSPAGSVTGTAVIVVRLLVRNPGRSPLRITELAVDGTGATRRRLPLPLAVGPDRAAGVDLSLRPDCTPGHERPALQVHLIATGPGGPVPEIPVQPVGQLDRAGGLCKLADTALPSGWRTPLQALGTRLRGNELEITLADLSADPPEGLTVENRILSTVFLEDQVVSGSTWLRPGRPTLLTIRHQAPCALLPDGNRPSPNTVRILGSGVGGLQQRLVIVGPALSRWLELDCLRAETTTNGIGEPAAPDEPAAQLSPVGN